MATVTAQQFTRELRAAEKGGLAQEVAKELGKQAQLAVGHIVGRHLSGPRGGAHTLGVVTSRLRSSVRATTPVVNGTRIECSIGTNVSYAGVHEFGFNGTVSVRAHQRRLRCERNRKRQRRIERGF